MEKELRNKFVIVTMSLMCIVFAVFSAASSIMNNYWYKRETLEFVKWIAESDVLLHEPSDSAGRKFIEDNSEYGPVTAFILSEDKEIKERLIDENTEYNINAEKTVSSIDIYDSETWKTGTYIYTVKNLDDSQFLVIMVNTRNDDLTPVKIITDISLIILAVVVLSVITVYLSGFVTEPARRAMLREKQFISDASHELKTPLGAISINAQALETVSGGNKHLKNIISESDRMSRLIERLLTLSKLEENKDVPGKVFSLSDCTEEMALTYESVAYDKGIDYRYEVEKNISLCGTEDDIRQIAAILTDNALKNTDAGGVIKISLRREKNSVIFRVENSGKGISEEDLPHIFERFYQSDSSRSGNSFGLGLAIARAAAERNGGIISAENCENGITCFSVKFM